MQQIQSIQSSHAVSADLEKMFNQVLVRPSDKDALRFLWWPVGSDQPPQTFQMQVQTFCVVSSPTIRNFTLQRAATESSDEFPDALKRIVDNFYVNNYLDSFDDQTITISVSSGVAEILRRGNFKLTKWPSSLKRILVQKPKMFRMNLELYLEMD